VQVDPIKPMLKAPETKLLKLKYDTPLSKFAFKFNLRRCPKGEGEAQFSLGFVFVSEADGDAGRGLHTSIF